MWLSSAASILIRSALLVPGVGTKSTIHRGKVPSSGVLWSTGLLFVFAFVFAIEANFAGATDNFTGAIEAVVATADSTGAIEAVILWPIFFQWVGVPE
jgi:hypothetical protein